MATNIPSTPADGNIKTVLVPAVADLSAPTVTELTGQDVIDISCYLVRNGFALTTDQQVITDERERSEEHTSELQSRENLVCRLLLEKKKQINREPNQMS